MSRIPPVRTWRVRYFVNGRIALSVDVETINKRFARWLARDHAWSCATIREHGAERVTVSLVTNK